MNSLACTSCLKKVGIRFYEIIKFLGNSLFRGFEGWCERGDLNPHTQKALPPQGSVSTVPPRSHS